MGTQTPSITIVMPTYNQAQYIRTAIDSILNQTFKEFVLIVVDDGCTDSTPSILTEYACKDSRVKVITKETNTGTGDSLNVGFGYSHTTYETWFASDNFMSPTCLESLFNFIDHIPNCDFVYANCDILDELDNTTINIKSEVVTQEWDRERLINQYYLGVFWLWKRALRVKSGLFQTEPCEDYDMVLRFVLAGGKFYFLDANLGSFRRHQLGMTNQLRLNSNIDYPKFVQDKYREVWG